MPPIAQREALRRSLLGGRCRRLLGLALFIGVWALVAQIVAATARAGRRSGTRRSTLFSDPFYRKGPNDQGIGWNILILAAARRHRLRSRGASVGIPLGLHPRPLQLR